MCAHMSYCGRERHGLLSE